MRNLRTYHSATIADFLCQPTAEILGIVHSNDISAETTIQQSNTWEVEVKILEDQLHGFKGGQVIFEYTIPRKRRFFRAKILDQSNNIYQKQLQKLAAFDNVPRGTSSAGENRVPRYVAWVYRTRSLCF